MNYQTYRGEEYTHREYELLRLHNERWHRRALSRALAVSVIIASIIWWIVR